MQLTKANRFKLGRIVGTPGAVAKLTDLQAGVLLARHSMGDWGDMGPEDREANEQAVEAGDLRVFSAYDLPDGERVWVITEADRSSTTILLPSEY